MGVVVERLRYFIREEVSAAGGAMAETLFGKDAYASKFAKIKANFTAGTATEEEGRFLHMWIHWYDDTQAQEATNLSKQILSGVTAVVVAAPKTKKSKAAMESAVAEATMMFN